MRSSWRCLGSKAPKLGVRFQPEGRPATVTVQRDSDSTPVLVELQCFDVVDPAVPNDWTFLDFGSGRYSLAPREFGGDFRDRYHDADSDPERTFERVVKKLDAYHSQIVPASAG